MSLSLVTGPATEPVTIGEAKAHLRLDSAAGEVSPLAPTVALASPAAPGNVDNGVHRYRVTFVTADGETDGGAVSAAVTVANLAVNGKVELTAIPLGGSAVTSRKVYRTTANTSTYLLLTTVANNTATTYTDNIADSSLTTAVPTANTTEDPTVNALIVAAREYAELETARALITQTWALKLDYFPYDLIWIPKPPLQTISSIAYTDSAGSAQTWAASSYIVDAPSGDYAEPGRVSLAYQELWPTTRDIANALTVTFVAGYGAASAVPQTIKQAMLLMIGHWYEHRESVNIGNIVSEIPLTAQALLGPYNARRYG